MSRRQKIVLVSILLVGAFLIFFRLGRQDMLGDDAIYSFRALAYFDYVGSNVQTTPVQWFGTRPAWSYLSFHDHPPMYFLLQNIAFKIFGASVVSSRLVSSFAAVLSLFFIYKLGRRLGGVGLGIAAAFALALNSYFIWMGRIGLLESLMSLFTILGLLFLVKGLREDSKHFYWAGMFFGFAFLTKYLILYALPGVAVYLLWKERRIFRDKKFWLGILVFIAVASPVIIYNLFMYHTRGHFDVMFSGLFRQGQHDWTNLAKNVSKLSLNPLGLIRLLISGFSLPYFIIFTISLSTSIFVAVKRKQPLFFLAILVFFSFFMFFTLMGSADRWVGVITPSVALIIAIVADALRNANFYVKFKPVSIVFAVLVGLFCLFYTVNTNTLYKAVGSQYLYSPIRVENYGYNQLDQELTSLLRNAVTTLQIQEMTRLWWYKDIDPKAIDFSSIRQGSRPFRTLIVYDSNNTWFPTLWIFEKWKFFHRITIMSSEEFFKVVSTANGSQLINSLGYDGIYLIQSGEKVREKADIHSEKTDVLVDNFRNQNIQPEIIHDDNNREAFYIYEGILK